MRVGKRCESGTGTRRTPGVLVHHRWRRWAERSAAALVRRSARLPLDVVYARPLAPWTVERVHIATELVRVQPSMQLHVALAFANATQTFAAQPGPAASSPSDGAALQSVRRSRVIVQESLATAVTQRLLVAHRRLDTFESHHRTAARLEQTHAVSERRVTDVIEQMRHRSERVSYELPPRVVHRRVEAAPARREEHQASLPVSRTRGRDGRDADIARRDPHAAALPGAPFGFDLHRVTDEVVRQIDRRLIATRERMGRV